MTDIADIARFRKAITEGPIPLKNRRTDGHLTDPVDRRLARLIARSMQVPGRHGFSVLFREFMQRGYEAVKQLPKADRR